MHAFSDEIQWGLSELEGRRIGHVNVTEVPRGKRHSRAWRFEGEYEVFYLLQRLPRSGESAERQRKRFEREVLGMKLAAFAAPELITCSSERYLLLTCELARDPSVDEVSPKALGKSVACLQAIHSVSAPESVFGCYVAEETMEYITGWAGKVRSSLHIPSRGSRIVLLHGNPNPGNVCHCCDGRVRILDWEDCHLGCEEYDFAYLASHLAVSRQLSVGVLYDLAKDGGALLNRTQYEEFCEILIAYIEATEPILMRYMQEGKE